MKIAILGTGRVAEMHAAALVGWNPVSDVSANGSK